MSALKNNLLGSTVQLTIMRSEDVPLLEKWLQDSATLRLLDTRPAFPRSAAALASWVEKRQQPKNDYLFAIRLNEDARLLGYIELDEINWLHHTAGIAYLIGDKADQRQGYAGEALALALQFAFNELNIYRLTLTAFSYNQASIALAEKLGFQREGNFRQFFARDGQRHDMYLYGLLRPEWEENH